MVKCDDDGKIVKVIWNGNGKKHNFYSNKIQKPFFSIPVPV